MKRYMAFYGLDYYPDGGMQDFIGSFDLLDEAIEEIIKHKYERDAEHEDWEFSWCHVWDLEKGEIIYERQN